MRSPGFYPERPDTIELVESLISWSSWRGTGPTSRASRSSCPFLDYGTRERRRAMFEEEVRLGRRLAPNLYRGVRPLVQTTDEWALGAPGDAGAKHVVEMRRFGPGRTLVALVEWGAADEATVRAVARRIAAFHAGAEPAPPGRFDRTGRRHREGELQHAAAVRTPAGRARPRGRSPLCGRIPPCALRTARGAGHTRLPPRLPRRPARRARGRRERRDRGVRPARVRSGAVRDRHLS